MDFVWIFDIIFAIVSGLLGYFSYNNKKFDFDKLKKFFPYMFILFIIICVLISRLSSSLDTIFIMTRIFTVLIYSVIAAMFGVLIKLIKDRQSFQKA